MLEMHFYGNQKDKRILAQIERDYKILEEFKLYESLKSQLRGIYVIPSHTSALIWFGVLFTYHGIYANSVFRFWIVLPASFPDGSALPMLCFAHDPMHPHVCSRTRCLDIKHNFSTWRREDNHLWQLLHYVQMIFNDPAGSVRGIEQQCTNPHLAVMCRKNLKSYMTNVRLAIEVSNSHIWDKPTIDDPHYLVFEKFVLKKHGPLLERMACKEHMIVTQMMTVVKPAKNRPAHGCRIWKRKRKLGLKLR